MLCPGDRVVAGISGGADSVCLFFLLLALQQKMELPFGVVHVNHGIRPEAGEDALYVEELCKKWGVAFFLAKKDVRAEAKVWKCSEEEAGRRIRYEAFRQAAESFRADKIAVAHNSNDRSETMLFHLFRGTGIKGLGSIPPVRDRIIRPILCLERQEIEEYLDAKGVSYCIDATNNGDDYTRNRIRHHILPYAEEEIAPGCVSHMARTAELLLEVEDYLQQQTLEAVRDCVICDGTKRDGQRYAVSVAGLLHCHPALQKRVLFHLVKALSSQAKDISHGNISYGNLSYGHIEKLLKLFTGKGNHRVSLPFGIVGRREYDRVILEKEEAADVEEAVGLCLSQEEAQYIFWGKFCIKYEILENFVEKNQELPRNEYTKWFDCDKIIKSPEIRVRKPGDYLTLADKEGKLIHQSLKDFFINKKIPVKEREQIPLLAEDSHVIWLVGYRISEYYKVSKDTKHILQIQIIRET
ncbi:MAG: tRNA lysidine(34) synthetase TilS [Bacteroidales bacterium]|nr:tRNA lysidine(34) synthetase TilS [Lachnoclostridium sp.]MCM1384449.1 tRNA lysidine(34) synthetase TilS [Lachnoclostridium sp.]MCM1465229.1 tRNA lysidine(34) synthetase TilS [Bacteroidales bacterium]